MDIARYSLNKPINIWLLSICFIIGGIVAMSKIGRLEDPAFTNKAGGYFYLLSQVQVLRQVEKEVTEQA